MTLSITIKIHATQHNNNSAKALSVTIKHDTPHKNKEYIIQHNNIQHIDTQHNNVTTTLSITTFSITMLSISIKTLHSAL
jgi:hypothetical protein